MNELIGASKVMTTLLQPVQFAWNDFFNDVKCVTKMCSRDWFEVEKI